MKNPLVWILIIAIIIVGVLLLRGENKPSVPSDASPAGEGSNTTERKGVETMEKKEGVTVVYENNAFIPERVTMRIGATVTFINRHASDIRLSSNPHPVHTSYRKLESGELPPGASYVFQPTEKAVIKYHNHLNPAAGGEIVVE